MPLGQSRHNGRAFALHAPFQSAGHPLNERPMSTALRPSACPGLLRIVQALDGGICRIKLNGGSISAAQAEAVASAAERFAGGVIEATNRANLQIRGIGSEHGGLDRQPDGRRIGPKHCGWRRCAQSDAQPERRDRSADAVRYASVGRTDPRHACKAMSASTTSAPNLPCNSMAAKAWRCSNIPMTCGCPPLSETASCVLAFGLAGCPVGLACGRGVAGATAMRWWSRCLSCFLNWRVPTRRACAICWPNTRSPGFSPDWPNVCRCCPSRTGSA